MPLKPQTEHEGYSQRQQNVITKPEPNALFLLSRFYHGFLKVYYSLALGSFCVFRFIRDEKNKFSSLLNEFVSHSVQGAIGPESL